MLRVGVVPAAGCAEAVVDSLRAHGIDVRWLPTEPVALVIAVATTGAHVSAAQADVEITAEGRDGATAAAAELYRTRLAPWSQALASSRPDVTSPPRLQVHDSSWGITADRRAESLRRALAGVDPADQLGLRRIDHIGSTAVADLAAKPILDLQMTLDRLPDPEALATAVAPLGWAPAAGARPDSPGVHRDLRLPQDTAPDEAYTKRLLVAPDPVRPAILHVRLTASPFARRAVRFRDRLRTDPSLRRDYERLKRNAAAAHACDGDYDDYTRDKTSWLIDAYREVDAWVDDEDPWPLDP